MGTAPLRCAVCTAGTAQVLNALEHRYDNPAAIPARELPKLIYGRDSVFAREPTPEQVAGQLCAVWRAEKAAAGGRRALPTSSLPAHSAALFILVV
jgi:hypothetical protein